jgi:hypothetical protein
MPNDDPTAPARSRRRTLPAAVQAAVSLQDLQQLEAFQKANAHVFPSVPSLRWFYRQHREELLKAGAVVELTGRLLINAPVFAEKAIAIGCKVASERNER